MAISSWFALPSLRRAHVLSVILISSFASIAASQDTFQTATGPVVVTPIRHASLTLAANKKLVYVDPSPAALFVHRAKADLILITDIHADHLDLGAISELHKGDTTIIAPPAVSKHISGSRALQNGQETTWDGWRIEAVPMYNIRRGPEPGLFYHPKGRGNGYVLTYGGKRFYIAGDTENIPEMRNLKNIEVAFIPMNLPFTMTPQEAAAAVKAFHPRVVYPYHYRNGNGTLADLNQFKADLAGTGIEVRLRDWYPKE
jgi:L-ascorbate metabolism protein UlaG (beta-lactamase superfamily)